MFMTTYIHNQFDFTYPFSFPLSYSKMKENTYLITYNLCFSTNDFSLKQGCFQHLKKQFNVANNQTDLYITLSIPNPSKDIFIEHLNHQNELIYISYIHLNFHHNYNSLAKQIIQSIADDYIYTNLKQNLMQTLPIIFNRTRNHIPYIRGL